MDDINLEKPEDWTSFHKRVIAVESFNKRRSLPHIREVSLVAIILGLLLIVLYNFVLRILIIEHFGSILVVLGIAGFIINYWATSSSGTIDKERQKSIQDRGMRERCKYLQGQLPDGLSQVKGFCTLYQKDLETYPFCMYCKSYITLRMEEKKLKAKTQ
jgi:hypothetical protein